jgi:hypothetical protein
MQLRLAAHDRVVPANQRGHQGQHARTDQDGEED